MTQGNIRNISCAVYVQENRDQLRIRAVPKWDTIVFLQILPHYDFKQRLNDHIMDVFSIADSCTEQETDLNVDL